MNTHGNPKEKLPWENDRPREVEMFWLVPLLSIVLGGIAVWFVIYDLNNGTPTVGPMAMLVILALLFFGAIFLAIVGLRRLFKKRLGQALIYIIVAVLCAFVVIAIVWPIVSAPTT